MAESFPFGGAGEHNEPERVRSSQRRAFAESGAANAVCHYDPTCEKGVLKSPQAFQNPKLKIFFPLNMRKANAERIPNRPALPLQHRVRDELAQQQNQHHQHHGADEAGARNLPDENRDDGTLDLKKILLALAIGFGIGLYDGIFGPGTGTFLILIFCSLAKLDVRTACGNMKLVNLASNVGALTTSIMNGKVFFLLGLIGTVSSVTGHYLGAGLAIKDGSKIVRPMVVAAIVLLAIKVVSEIFA